MFADYRTFVVYEIFSQHDRNTRTWTFAPPAANNNKLMAKSQANGVN